MKIWISADDHESFVRVHLQKPKLNYSLWNSPERSLLYRDNIDLESLPRHGSKALHKYELVRVK